MADRILPEPPNLVSTADLREQAGIALGAASMCWSPRPAGEFDSAGASQILDELMEWAEAYGSTP